MDVAVARLTPRFASLPFWFDAGVTPALAVKALVLSVMCAVVAGVLPALRATGRRLQPTMQVAGMGGGTLRLGRIAGALIVIEIAMGTVAVFGGGLIWRSFQSNSQVHTRVAEAHRYLVASIRIPRSEIGPPAAGDDEKLRVRLRTLQDALGRRLTSQPAVHGWTFSDRPPGSGQERGIRMDQAVTTRAELEGPATLVDPSFFSMLHVAPVAGRLFGAADVGPDPAVEPATAIVNMKFLELRGMEAQSGLGARLQLTVPEGGRFGPWKQIVGVVPNIDPAGNGDLANAAPLVYLPAAAGALNPMTVTIDLGNPGDAARSREPMAFAPTLQQLVTDAEPTALLENVAALDELRDDTGGVFRFWMSVTSGISVLATLLSTTALYALMSMTVAQRKREFGIRLALGGSTTGVIVAVARRALAQIAAGVALGVGFWVVILSTVLRSGEIARTVAEWPYLLVAAAAVVIAIGLAASLGPTLKYARLRPVETLRLDG
jgi:putative ABC transport system permease protein